MKFSEEKKNSIKMYILEKIEQNTSNVSGYVSRELGISQNTVCNYIKELLADGAIIKSKRGQYELVTKRFAYVLKRSKGHLEHDTYAYDAYVYPLIQKLPSGIEHIWSYAVSEMVNNVIDHSGAEDLFIQIEQNYLTTRVMLCDNGIGIFKKIKEHFSFATLDDAVCELFKGKLTTDASNHSGEGIFFTSKMMDLFLILSDGKVFTTSKYENDHIFDQPEAATGTCVIMELSNFTNKNAAEIFDMYSGTEGSFCKTKIPLKNIFDKAPISRSQAKRICHRLEHFKEVVLDFSGIDWMGQGFAHQLFVVYQNAHPEIIFTPIHMEESVKKMYDHVMGSK